MRPIDTGRFPSAQNQSDITIGGEYYWLYFALISRLYNPQLQMTAIVDRYQAVLQNTAVHEALQGANIKVKCLPYRRCHPERIFCSFHMQRVDAPGPRPRQPTRHQGGS